MRPSSSVQTAARAVSVQAGEAASLLQGQTYVPKSQSLLDSLLAGRTYVPGAAGSGNGTFVDGLRTGVGPTSSGVPFTASRSVTWAATAKAASRALPLVGTALVVKDLFDEIRCREAFGGGPECDEGRPEVPQNQRCGPTPGVSGFDGAPFQPAGEACASSQGGWAFALASHYNAAGREAFVVSQQTLPDGNFNVVINFRTSPSNPASRNTASHTTNQNRSVLVCPADGLPPTVLPVKGPDGKCPTAVYEPATYPEVESKIDQFGQRTRAPALWPLLDQAGIPIEHPAPAISGPAAIQGGRQTTTLPDGSTITKDTDHPLTYRPEGYDWQDRVTERTWPPGVTPEAPGTPPGATTPPPTTTTGAPPPTPVEVYTCGLPGKPPCKIDESGTPPPPPPDVFGDPGADASAPLRLAIENPQIADITWTWTFQLPTACSPIELPAFAEWLPSVDVCQFQAMFHDLFSLVWVGVGFFGAWSMLHRTMGGT